MDTSKLTTCFFTGHRQIHDSEHSALSARLDITLDELVPDGYDTFVCGGAVGFDTLAACRVIAAKRRHPDIKLVLALPCHDQTARWRNLYDIELYRRIKGYADKVMYTSDVYTPRCMLDRNRQMANMSSLCIAYYKGGGGGTAYTVEYAKKNGIPIINLASKENEQIKISE